ncbi:MAG: lamin tail domain-containing protein [Gammaproteobacteria bacterium]
MLATRLAITFLLCCTTAPAFATLIFSEYVEGSSYNKAVEIFNTGTDVDLDSDDYAVEIYSNGSLTASYSFNLSGTMLPGSTYVITHSRADSALQTQANLLTGSLNFNGDDAIVLLQNGNVLDRIGQVGVDPGSAWGNGAVSTQNHTLRRHTDITNGDVNVTAVFEPDLQWQGFDTDVFDGLGFHTTNFSAIPVDEPNTSVPAPASLLLLATGLTVLGFGRRKIDQL